MYFTFPFRRIRKKLKIKCLSNFLLQLMLEKRQERERDHTRHTVEIRQLEHSLNSRERMYKERIAGLEDQV